ncbi:MAG: hypothetical protein ABSB15_24315 [Bryobacteraceae bacterium]|jgi:hypothetical protein
MINSPFARFVCIVLSFLIAAPCGFGQAPPSGAPPTSVIPPPQQSSLAGTSLIVGILEGDKAVNSLPLLRMVAPVVEIRDRNDFPVEGATVVFTLPASGPGGTFAGGGTSFTTRSDARGQAAAPAIVPRLVGKFEIKVSATLGTRTGEAVITQTNSAQAHPESTAQRHWYKNKWVWVAAGGGAAGVIAAVLLTRHSGSGTTVTITPGSPVFQ